MECKLLGSPVTDGWSCGSTVAFSETASGCWYESVCGGAARCYDRAENPPGVRRGGHTWVPEPKTGLDGMF